MFEHRSTRLLSRAQFLRRLARHGGFALIIAAASLGVGVLGYHEFAGLSWIDSLLNASMLLGGMGPVDELHTATAKLFAACYALFAGLAFLVFAGVIFAPIFHRFLHRFHLDAEDENEGSKG